MPNGLHQAKVEMTPEERQKFEKAMGDPEFRKILAEYMDEISDPAHRAENEKYFEQLEADNYVPKDKELIRPAPGFVVKVKASHVKVFVNICHSDKMGEPVASVAQKGTNWKLPYSIGPQRIEMDKGGNPAVAFDVCFHPKTLAYAATSAKFNQMVCNTAVQAAQGLYKKGTFDQGKCYHDQAHRCRVSYSARCAIQVGSARHDVYLESVQHDTVKLRKQEFTYESEQFVQRKATCSKGSAQEQRTQCTNHSSRKF